MLLLLIACAAASSWDDLASTAAHVDERVYLSASAGEGRGLHLEDAARPGDSLVRLTAEQYLSNQQVLQANPEWQALGLSPHELLALQVACLRHVGSYKSALSSWLGGDPLRKRLAVYLEFLPQFVPTGHYWEERDVKRLLPRGYHALMSASVRKFRTQLKQAVSGLKAEHWVWGLSVVSSRAH